MTTQEYAQKVFETALKNGLTPQQIISNPEAAATAYLKAQLRAIDDAGKKAYETISYAKF